ncbi:MAG: DUF6635 family protein [Pseudomonadota bacterium]|nr:DUF6635 family protein [Pseudomonadota bacterium]
MTDHDPSCGRSAEDEAALRAAIETAARAYFDSRRARVDGFVARWFHLRGSLRLHRAALGWDIARAPANIALAPVHLLTRAGAAGAGRLGARRAAAWLGTRDLVLRTDVARAVERAVMTDLLELPWRGEDGAGPPPARRDALAEAILADPAVRAALPALIADAPARRADDLSEYLGTRAAVAEMTAALTTMGAGAAAFSKLTPGAVSLGPSIAALLAHNAAVAAFPLGAGAGSLWYAAFPAAASPALVGASTAALAGAGALLAAFAGVVADPVQSRLGVHRRRLLRLIDAMEAEFLAESGPGFAAREHYLARLFDLSDAAAAAIRLARG